VGESRDERLALLGAAERVGARERAVVLMLFAGCRIGATVALEVDDVRISARTGITYSSWACQSSQPAWRSSAGNRPAEDPLMFELLRRSCR
jgi:hypothetical protein